jgi:Electron transfer flavoprotein, beta subunit
MKVLVAVKRVLDYNIKARVKADKTGVDLANVKMSINPFDEIAVEEAVKLKEAGKVNEIIVASIGSTACQETIRSALALGADRGILIETSQEIQPLTAAKILQKIVEKENPTLVLMGKQAIDDDANQTGQMLAGLLDWAQGTFMSHLDLKAQEAVVTREVDGGLEIIKCSLPAILTTDLRLNVPRYPKLPNIMKAKQKPLEVLSPDALGITIKVTQKTLEVKEPAPRQGGRKVKDVAELIDCLKNEAKVI